MCVRDLISRLQELPESAIVRIGHRYAGSTRLARIDWDAQDSNRVNFVSEKDLERPKED